jgi:hypothetical protein
MSDGDGIHDRRRLSFCDPMLERQQLDPVSQEQSPPSTSFL